MVWVVKAEIATEELSLEEELRVWNCRDGFVLSNNNAGCEINNGGVGVIFASGTPDTAVVLGEEDEVVSCDEGFLNRDAVGVKDIIWVGHQIVGNKDTRVNVSCKQWILQRTP